MRSGAAGRLFALGGVSLGGQIVLELLSRKPELAEKAIVDGKVFKVIPGPPWRGSASPRWPVLGLMFSERACRFQLAAMPKILPEKMLYPE